MTTTATTIGTASSSRAAATHSLAETGRMASAEALTTIMGAYQPGQAVSITYVTPSGSKASASLTLISEPPK
jgi:hypothetical protein